MPNVFVSYRREDSAPWAGRICDRLEAAFGTDHVFMDVQDIAPGQDFTQAIDRTVGSCDVLIAVIGPRWLETLRQREGGRDFVEHEIASALKRNITVIPVLVGDAAMPSEAELPAEIAGLGRRQAVCLRDASFNADAGQLLEGVRRATSSPARNRPVWLVLAAGVAIALVATGVFLWASRERASLDGAWIARMQRPGQRAYTIRLELRTSGAALSGRVSYPTGSGAIEGGTFERGRLAFSTRHVPQFETEPATIVFSGEVRGSEIELTATTPDGVATLGVARKTQ